MGKGINGSPFVVRHEDISKMKTPEVMYKTPGDLCIGVCVCVCLQMFNRMRSVTARIVVFYFKTLMFHSQNKMATFSI